MYITQLYYPKKAVSEWIAVSRDLHIKSSLLFSFALLAM